MRALQHTGCLAVSVVLAILTTGVFAAPSWAAHVPASRPAADGHSPRLVMPLMDPARGKKLFVGKGCVACHAINGVGGHDAPAMDAHTMDNPMNPFDFAAKMWNHAPAMIAAQEGALGGQVYLTGDDLAHIIAFIHNDQAQHGFSDADMTPEARKMMDHEHHGELGPESHAEEIGHQHGEGKPGAPEMPKHQH